MAPFIAQTTIDQVKAYPDIVGIISDFVTLKKRGRNYIGLCPFHSEKSPSFTVSPDKQIFHCFGCHESGDHIEFVRKIDNLTFPEAIRYIAQKAGIDVQEEERTHHSFQDDKEKEAIWEALLKAREYFKSQLKPNTKAHTYITTRGVTQHSLEQFHIGFAPHDLNIFELLKNQNIEESIIVKAGLGYRNDQGLLVTRFRNRLIFPIIDYRGKTVGFSGRTLDPESKTAKYVNSEETTIFNKRKIVYALGDAKRHISQSGYAIVMEGFMDVILSHQSGIKNAIATMGTAITSEHAQKLKRFTTTLYMAMDSDEAGQASIERSYETLKNHDFKLYVLALKDKDPADLLLSSGVEAFQTIIENPEPIIAFMFERACAKYPAKNIEQVPLILEQVLPLLRAEKDPIISRHYSRLFSKKLGIDEDLILAKLKKSQYNISRRLKFDPKNKKDKYTKAEERLICAMASDLDLRRQVMEVITPEHFMTQKYKAIVEAIIQKPMVNKALLEALEDPDIKKSLSQVLITNAHHLQEGEINKSWNDYVQTLQSFKVEKQLVQLKERLKVLEAGGNEAEALEVLQQLQSLKQK